MTREDGFEIADTDSGMMADPKVLALARRLRDPTRTGAAIALYDAVRLASWKAGRRLTLPETLPGWWLDPVDDLAGALVAVGLLDDEQKVPAHAWEGWFGPAYERREERRDSGARGGRAKAANERNKAAHLAELEQSHSRAIAEPYPSVRPSGPSDRPSRAPAREGDGSGDPTNDGPEGVLREPAGLPSPEKAAQSMAAIRASLAPKETTP